MVCWNRGAHLTSYFISDVTKALKYDKYIEKLKLSACRSHADNVYTCKQNGRRTLLYNLKNLKNLPLLLWSTVLTQRSHLNFEFTSMSAPTPFGDILLGPRPQPHTQVLSCTGNIAWHVLVIADYFTKWTEAFPMSNMEAHTVAECRMRNRLELYALIVAAICHVTKLKGISQLSLTSAGTFTTLQKAHVLFSSHLRHPPHLEIYFLGPRPQPHSQVHSCKGNSLATMEGRSHLLLLSCFM